MITKVLILDAYSPAHIGNGALLSSSIRVARRAFVGAAIRFLALETTTPNLITDVPYDEIRGGPHQLDS